jgi:hypothetical protein
MRIPSGSARAQPIEVAQVGTHLGDAPYVEFLRFGQLGELLDEVVPGPPQCLGVAAEPEQAERDRRVRGHLGITPSPQWSWCRRRPGRDPGPWGGSHPWGGGS